MKNTPPLDPSKDLIVPVSLSYDWQSEEDVIAIVRQQHTAFGFTRFALIFPQCGWRSAEYPPRSYFEEEANRFRRVREAVADEGLECGCFLSPTIKCGRHPDFEPIVRADGSESPYANCPLDPIYRKRYCEDIARFCEIARPAFVFFEDDFSLSASFGCFCPRHLGMLSERIGKPLAREELVSILSQMTDDAYRLKRMWREVLRDTLVSFAEDIRREADKKTPEIPFCSMESGGSDFDGYTTEAVARALAGADHIPTTRVFGAFYGGFEVKRMPAEMFRSLYVRQNTPRPFRFYREADSFPHTRFFTSGAHMRTVLGTMSACGFEGFIYQTQQILDHPFEEDCYGKVFREEGVRLAEVRRIASLCTVTGVRVCYDPFENTADDTFDYPPDWVSPLARFGIPYTTLPSEVTFWDERQARFADDAKIRDALSHPLFLDGAAAKKLCERGYSAYLGVTLGEDVANEGKLRLDLGAREVVREKFRFGEQWENLPSAFTYAPSGNGFLPRMTVTDPACEVISELVNFRREVVCPAMTRFSNSLGGTVVILGETLRGNKSQSLFNYRRMTLIRELIRQCVGDLYPTVTDAPDIWLICSEATDPAVCGFDGMMTLTNLCEDTPDGVTLYLPRKWERKRFLALDRDGGWRPLDATVDSGSLRIAEPLPYLAPMYLLVTE